MNYVFFPNRFTVIVIIYLHFSIMNILKSLERISKNSRIMYIHVHKSYKDFYFRNTKNIKGGI